MSRAVEISRRVGQGEADASQMTRRVDHTLAIEARLKTLDARTLVVWGTDDIYFDVKWSPPESSSPKGGGPSPPVMGSDTRHGHGAL
ncbi:MAG: hypothetical protein ABIX28_20735 [Vicinamibacterales bacterium]